jgi:hypothetical protein
MMGLGCGLAGDVLCSTGAALERLPFPPMDLANLAKDVQIAGRPLREDNV